MNEKIHLILKVRRDVYNTGGCTYVFKIRGYKPTVSIFAPMGLASKCNNYLKLLYKQSYYQTEEGQQELLNQNGKEK